MRGRTSRPGQTELYDDDHDDIWGRIGVEEMMAVLFEPAPPGSPVDRNDQLKQPNWFATQLSLAILIGASSFVGFSFARSTRRFSWVLPTLRASDQTVLQAGGLDGLVLLYFFQLGFYYFLTATLLAFTILVPINVHENGTTEGVPPEPTSPAANTSSLSSLRLSHLTRHITPYHLAHLAFTYLFSLILLRFLETTYLKLITFKPPYCLSNPRTRQSLGTIILENLPRHLRNDHALKDYLEQVLGYPVISVEVLRDVTDLLPLLKQRTAALQALELAYTQWVGRNPGSSSHPSQTNRPRYRPKWYSLKSVDAIDHWQKTFDLADQLVRSRRKGKFKSLDIGFASLQRISDAQILCQTIHWPVPEQAIISLAPDYRDIHWPNFSISARSRRVRITVVWLSMALLYGFWAPPVSFVANLMSYDVLVSFLSPVLVGLIESSSVVKALIQNSLPTLAIIGFNTLLPFVLEWLCTFQGFKSRSAIEYSLLKKYHLFLLVTVLFIFVAVSTVSLLRDIRDNPGGVIDKIARSLPGARNFFISYLILQSLAVLPLQLLSLPTLFSRIFTRACTHEKEVASEIEVLSLGNIYPQALLAFNICITYSVIAPLILVFGVAYFGMGYLVYKYKILNVYRRPFESRAEAWPIACNRIGWGLIIFQVFMLGLLSLRQVFILSTLVLPLIGYTIFRLLKLQKVYRRLAKYLPLSLIAELEAENNQPIGTTQEPITAGVTEERSSEEEQLIETLEPATQNLVHEDEVFARTCQIFTGVQGYGERVYGHPAVTGVLLTPRLPISKRDLPTEMLV